MKLAVFGASGPTGLQVVRQALALDHNITAATRNPSLYPITSPRLNVVEADVFDAAAVNRAVAGADAVISTFGVPYTQREVTLYSRGIANILQAMTHHGIARLVCVSSTGVSAREVPGETLFWRKVLFPFFQTILGGTVYRDMQRMEAVVRSSDWDWTIIRPAGLFDTTEPTPDYDVGPGRICGRLTSRADLAQTLIREATKPEHPHEIVEVITRSSLPSNAAVLRTIFRPKSRQ